MFTDVLIERLSSRGHEGSWGYGYRPAGCSEAAALGAMALASHDTEPARVGAALDWLAAIQTPDGGVPIDSRVANPQWPTALALSAWLRAGHGEYQPQCDAAVRYLLAHRGNVFPKSPLVGHDTEIAGWSWVDDTHSWVEPTAYAIAALREAGESQHERVRMGVRVLDDRCLPTGGWNYGNTRVLGNMLRPFPATTGIAMVALAGQPRGDVADNSLRYLKEVAPTLRAPVSLSWSVLGLRAWNEPVEQAWLERCVMQPGRRPPDPVHDALLLLAAAPSHQAHE